MKQLLAVIVLAMVASVCGAQQKTGPALPAVRCPECLLPFLSDASMLNVGSGMNRELVSIFAKGTKIMEAYDKDGHVAFTVYRDGRVEFKDKKKVSTEMKFFWQEFARYYRQEIPSCQK